MGKFRELARRSFSQLWAPSALHILLILCLSDDSIWLNGPIIALFLFLIISDGIQTWSLLPPTRPAHLPPYLQIAIPDILMHIIPLLSRPELVRCCRANRLFFEFASKPLYADRNGVLAGRERYYAWSPGSPGKHYMIEKSKRTLFAGFNEPADFNTTNPEILQIYLDNPPYKPLPRFQPSPLKLKLLRHVTHIIYATDMTKEYDTLDATGWFPNLRTLTIQVIGPVYAQPLWALPFLSSLRPKHVRITHVRTLGTKYGSVQPYILDSPLGSLVEKVTIHFVDCNVENLLLGAIDVKWPGSLKSIDLVFLAPSLDTRTGTARSVPLHDFTQTHPPPFPDHKLIHITQSIATLLVSAAKLNPNIRIIGMGPNDATVNIPAQVLVARKEAWGTDEASRFAADLRFAYGIELGIEEMDGKPASSRMGKLEYTAMEDYKQEEDYASFE